MGAKTASRGGPRKAAGRQADEHARRVIARAQMIIAICALIAASAITFQLFQPETGHRALVAQEALRAEAPPKTAQAGIMERVDEPSVPEQVGAASHSVPAAGTPESSPAATAAPSHVEAIPAADAAQPTPLTAFVSQQVPQTTVEWVLEDDTPGVLALEPESAWKPSSNTSESHGGSSIVAFGGSETHRATFIADIPVDGEYEVSAWWVASGERFRSPSVICTLYPSTGAFNATVDQVHLTPGPEPDRFITLGQYYFKAQKRRPVISFTTEGLPAGEEVAVSVDAIKLKLVRMGTPNETAQLSKRP